MTERLSNFDTIRLLAASSVIFSHAFLIADGNEAREPFVGLSGSILGIYGVYVFFVISGYLVTASMERTKAVPAYLWKRFLRIYPALIASAVVCAFLIGPFFSRLEPGEYLLSLSPEKHVAKTAMLFFESTIRTVTFYENVPPKYLGVIVNGSLWTILQEIICYLLVAVLWTLRALRPAVAAALFVIGTLLLWTVLTTSFWVAVPQHVTNFFYALAPFSAGMLIYFISHKRRPSGWLALGAAGVLIVLWALGAFEVGFALPAAIIVWYLAMSPRVRLGDAARFGDLSYGTYLYGWPVLQVLWAIVGAGFNPYLLAAMAIPISLGCAFLSWHLIEKRALALKRYQWTRRNVSLAEP